MTGFIHAVPEWLELIALAFLTGALVCRLWIFTPSAGAAYPRQESLLNRIWFVIGICMVTMIVSNIGQLFMRASEMSGQTISKVFPVISTVVFRTHLGGVWLIGIAALFILTAVAVAGRKRRDTRGFLFSMLAITIIISMTKSASGHASDAGDFSIPEILDWLHLIAALLWGGGLLVLSVILPELVMTGDPAAPQLAVVASRFSKIAGIAVALIAITALYNVWIYVGGYKALLGTPYGRIIIAKILLFFLLVNLGAFNRYINVPLLQEWGGFSPGRQGIINSAAQQFFKRILLTQDGHKIALRFTRSVRTEALLVAGVLLCVAMLRHEIPARHQSHMGHTGVGGSHANHEHMGTPVPGAGPVVRLETVPSNILAGTPVTMKASLRNQDGSPVEGLMPHHERMLHAIIIGKDLKVFAHIHPEDIGPVTNEMLKKATLPLRFAFPKAGEYLVGLDFATADGMYSKSSTVHVGGEPAMGGPETNFSTQRKFGRYRVTLTSSPAELKAGEKSTLRYLVEADGKEVKDLEPYLGAAMHLAVVTADLSLFIHAHGVVPGEPHTHQGDHGDMHSAPPGRFGPEIEADIVFPAKGTYKIFSQVEHHGKVLLFDFMVKVR